MKRNLMRIISLLSLSVLIAAVLSFTGCKEKKTDTPSESGNVTHSFTFKMKDGEIEKEFAITTGEKTVGAALLGEGLIEGTVEQYGLYVKKVCGIQHIYEEDGKYWAFYEGDQYSMTGVDMTDITDGAVYWLKAE